MTHEQAKIISAIGKWEIQVYDIVHVYRDYKIEGNGIDIQEDYVGVVTSIDKRFNEMTVYQAEKNANRGGVSNRQHTITLIPQEKHLLELLPYSFDTSKGDMTFQWELKIGKNGDLPGQEKEWFIGWWNDYKDDFINVFQSESFYEALTDAVMYYIENNLFVKEG